MNQCFALARAGALAALAFAFASTGRAGELPDPTRPPVTQRQAASSAAVAPAVAAPVLQSVLTGEGRTPVAVISGRMVVLGQSFDDMRLTRVTESTAQLIGPRGATLLALTPDAGKVAALASPAPLLADAAKPAPAQLTMSLRTAEHK